MKKSGNLSIGVLGLWHLGLVVSVCLAKSGYKVFGFDLDKKNIDKLNSAKPPIYEPKLSKYIKKYLFKKLYFSNDPKEVIKNKDYIFVTLDTPVNDSDEVDLSPLSKLFDLIVKYAPKNTTIIILSQVPIGTTRSLIKRLKNSTLIYFPENLRLGNAIEDFLNPSRIVLGSDSQDEVEQFLKDFPIFKCKILKMSVESAEMVKHALNSYLALNISFSSEFSDLCEALGANAQDVVLGLKSDPRVNPKAPINPGLGFSGGTLGRDIKILLKLSNKINYNAKLLKATYAVNQDRINYLLGKIKKVLPLLSGKRIGILGLTYKPNTDTLRRSQSLDLANLLSSEKAQVFGFDPAIKNQKIKSVNLADSIDEFLKNLDLLILMTEWPQFRDINPEKASKLMRKKLLVDTKNFLDRQKYEESGFMVLRMGEGR